MKTIEVVLFWIAIVALVGIGIGRFIMGSPAVLSFRAVSIITVVNTVLLLSILAKLHSK